MSARPSIDADNRATLVETNTPLSESDAQGPSTLAEGADEGVPHG